jgi:hypothetical protein
LFLADPRMQAVLQANLWNMPKEGRGGPHISRSARQQLALMTVRECLLGGAEVPAGLAAVQFLDGCPANCLARNLSLVARPGRRAAFEAWQSSLPPAQRPPAAMLPGPRVDAAAVAAARAAEEAARAAVQRLYGVAGAERGRYFLDALHEEYMAAWVQRGGRY